MKAQLFNNVLRVTSLKKADLAQLLRREPEALTLKDKEGNEYFKVSLSAKAISPYGIGLDRVNENGNIYAMFEIPHEKQEAVRKYIEDEFALALAYLVQWEQDIEVLAGQVASETHTVMSMIEEV